MAGESIKRISYGLNLHPIMTPTVSPTLIAIINKRMLNVTHPCHNNSKIHSLECCYQTKTLR